MTSFAGLLPKKNPEMFLTYAVASKSAPKILFKVILALMPKKYQTRSSPRAQTSAFSTSPRKLSQNVENGPVSC